MIFRWSIWGPAVQKDIELLNYSILSFKKQFGRNHHYILYTDSSKYVSKHLDEIINVKGMAIDATTACLTPKKISNVINTKTTVIIRSWISSLNCLLISF